MCLREPLLHLRPWDTHVTARETHRHHAAQLTVVDFTNESPMTVRLHLRSDSHAVSSSESVTVTFRIAVVRLNILPFQSTNTGNIPTHVCGSSATSDHILSTNGLTGSSWITFMLVWS